MPRQRITFPNQAGQALAATLELPERAPRAYALFAHCFTCGKDIAAASRIARTLTSHQIGVLRFDFTGLGGSEGDFGNDGLAADVGDLLAAAAYLRAHHGAPSLLIGHSLGGTAALAAAAEIPECTAVATIGSPASPAHVLKQFEDALERIESEGSATVELAGRAFTISRQFVDAMRAEDITQRITTLGRALLVFHAPLDATVSIQEASAIFEAARHPKSFVSLDDADHLVTRLADAQYVADTIASWAARYLPETPAEVPPTVAGGEVLVGEANHRFLRDVASDHHAWLADEPKGVGGDNLGPDPYEHLLAALGTCTSMTIRMYANRKKWPLEDVTVQLEHSREHMKDCVDCETAPARIDVLTRAVRLKGDLTDAQRQRLLEIADRCPVHRTLEGELRIDTVAWD